jgi:hypothetical protein
MAPRNTSDPFWRSDAVRAGLLWLGTALGGLMITLTVKALDRLAAVETGLAVLNAKVEMQQVGKVAVRLLLVGLMLAGLPGCGRWYRLHAPAAAIPDAHMPAHVADGPSHTPRKAIPATIVPEAVSTTDYVLDVAAAGCAGCCVLAFVLAVVFTSRHLLWASAGCAGGAALAVALATVFPWLPLLSLLVCGGLVCWGLVWLVRHRESIAHSLMRSPDLGSTTEALTAYVNQGLHGLAQHLSLTTGQLAQKA